MTGFVCYTGALAEYVARLGLKNGIRMLVSLAAHKMGLKPKRRAAALLECWTFFRYLNRERQVQVMAAAPNQFRLRCRVSEGRDSEVQMALRMPASLSSDSAVFDQIFVKHEYRHVVEWFSGIRPENIDTILDVGANIGCAALFFGARFPNARIYCLEPEAGNYQRLDLNLKLNPERNIGAARGAIWTRSCALRCIRDFRDGRESAYRFVESESGSDLAGDADAMDIQALSERAGFATVDLLKLDVEGAEATLLRDERFTGFLKSQVARIAVEVHEEFISIEEVRRVLGSVGFETGLVDEFVVGIKPIVS